MKNRTIAILLLTALTAAAQIGVPRLGCFADDQGHMRSVLGVTGNFLIGDPEADNVLSVACSDRLTLIKRDDSLEIRKGDSVTTAPAPAGPAIFGLSTDGSTTLVYYPATSEWFRTNGSDPQAIPGPPDGEVLAVGQPESPAAIVGRDGALWIAGAESRPLPDDAAAPVLLLPHGAALYTRGQELVLSRADGSEESIAMDEPPIALEWMGRGWVRVRAASGAHVALAVGRGGPGIRPYKLPEASQ
jgi:hypothetical protein